MAESAENCFNTVAPVCRLQNDYSNLTFVAQGGYAAIYSATHRGSASSRALKIMSSNNVTGQICHREVEAFIKISNKGNRNVVNMYDFWRNPSVPRIESHTNVLQNTIQYQWNTSMLFCISMDLCEGSLRRILSDRDKQFSSGNNFTEYADPGLWCNRKFNASARRQQLTDFKQILSGVRFLHKNKIIHRDLNPANVLYIGPPGNRTFKIADFGLSKFVTPETLAKSWTQIRTVPYTAPEQFTETSYDKRVDIYSLGVILLEMVYPVNADPDQNLENILRSVSRLPGRLEIAQPYICEVIKKMVNNDPGLRPKIKHLLKIKNKDEHGHDHLVDYEDELHVHLCLHQRIKYCVTN